MAEDISKLPKWAQNKIAVLESEIETAQRKIREMIPSGAETDVFLISGMDLIPLPKRSQIRFAVASGHIEIGHRSDLPDGVCVYGNERTINRRVCIRPQASNCFHICFKDD